MLQHVRYDRILPYEAWLLRAQGWLSWACQKDPPSCLFSGPQFFHSRVSPCIKEKKTRIFPERFLRGLRGQGPVASAASAFTGAGRPSQVAALSVLPPACSAFRSGGLTGSPVGRLSAEASYRAFSVLVRA